MDIHLVRSNSGNPKTNIEHRFVRKVETFDWGNTSDEAAELAYNILGLFCDELTRERLYLQFLRKIIVKVPYGGQTISQKEIEAWIANHSFLKDNRIKTSFLIAVYRHESEQNQIHFVEAYTEIEAIIRACENYETEDYIQSLLNQISDFDEVYEYYSSREIWYSEPVEYSL